MVKRAVKRVSSKKRAVRPKQKRQSPVSETVESMIAEVTAPASTGGAAVPAAMAVAVAVAVESPGVPVASAVPAGPPGRVVLGSSCTIHEAPALRAHLLDKASHPGPYEIDGSAVEQVDTA